MLELLTLSGVVQILAYLPKHGATEDSHSKVISTISFDSRILPFLSEMDNDVQRKSPYLRRRTDAHRAF